ncbi:hypothetical protein HMPREF3070_12585 [Clostridium sp. HMSC19A10]|nr:hypothetical protein HMPREF3070_12585 [Clostridium sp. HMSC19A10]
MDEWYDLKRRLIVQIELDKATLDSIIDIDSDIEDEEYLKLLETNEQKVSYCRIVKGYSQKETAKLIGISDRQVRRIEQKF